MAVFSKFAVSVAAVAVECEEGRCGTASALQMEIFSALPQSHDQINDGGAGMMAGQQLETSQNASFIGYPLAQAVQDHTTTTEHNNAIELKEHALFMETAVKDNLASGSPWSLTGADSKKSEVSAQHWMSSKHEFPTSSEDVQLLKKNWTMKAVERALPGRDKCVQETVFDLLNDVDVETLKEYCEAVNELGLSPDDMVAFIKDMPGSLQGAALKNYITAETRQQPGQIFKGAIKAVRMLKEKMECKGSDGMKDGSHPKEARSEIKGGDLFMACLLFICILVVCAGGLCLWAHWLCTRMGYAE